MNFFPQKFFSAILIAQYTHISIATDRKVYISARAKRVTKPMFTGVAGGSASYGSRVSRLKTFPAVTGMFAVLSVHYSGLRYIKRPYEV